MRRIRLAPSSLPAPLSFLGRTAGIIMFSTWHCATALSLLSVLARRALGFSPSFSYGTEPVRGVNLGGWLVLEVRRPIAHHVLSH